MAAAVVGMKTMWWGLGGARNCGFYRPDHRSTVSSSTPCWLSGQGTRINVGWPEAEITATGRHGYYLSLSWDSDCRYWMWYLTETSHDLIPDLLCVLGYRRRLLGRGRLRGCAGEP